jgi:hypothetical protein
MPQITGRCWLSVNGALLRSKTGAKLTGAGGIERTPVVGAQVWGYSEKAVAPTIEATLAHTADLSLQTLNAIEDATITFETDTGRTFLLNHAWCQTAPGLTDGEGDVPVTFGAYAIEEVSR